MEYTVLKLARLAGVSARTLRYYDTIGLLKPARLSSTGYRIYGPGEVDRLQQILFYRELEMPLDKIAELMRQPAFDRLEALRAHRIRLMQKRERLDTLIDTVQRSIAAQEGGFTMQDKEKFEGFKQAEIDRNEELFGAEIRDRYGDRAVDDANARRMGLSQEQYAAMEALGKKILRLLDAAFESRQDPGGEGGRELARAHREWLCMSWATYSPQAHRELAKMYLADPRFAEYYDRGVPGKAQFLHDAIDTWAEKLPQDPVQ